MSTGESRFPGSEGAVGPMGEEAHPVEAQLGELLHARQVLANMGIPDLDRLSVGEAIALGMTNLMRRHGQFMNHFGSELVARGVSDEQVNEAAMAAGLTLLKKAWAGGGR